MRVLLLHRQPFGGVATLAETLAVSLRKLGVQATVEAASEWMPNATDLSSSRKASVRLKEIGKDFDLVHALGYRAAWACGDAYSYREAWVYTAYGMPKTTHQLLIDKLNEGQIGFCSSYSVRDELSAAGAMDLIVRYPGVTADFNSDLSSAEARALFGLPQGVPLIGGLGRFVPERAFNAFLEGANSLWEALPEAHLVLSGEGPEGTRLKEIASASSKPGQITILGRLRRSADFYKACDLLVVPSVNSGFSIAAAECMKVGTAVLMRSEGGLPEMGDAEHTVFFFRSDDELGNRIAELIKMPMMLQSVANAGRIRAESLFVADPYAEAILKSYRSVLE